ncbi:MAG: acyl carrier protein [Planctomycetes bacterium]|nr:acyl carrier protein [Planctomycetota bacterium]
MTSLEEIYAEVRSTLVEVSGTEAEGISPSLRLVEDLGLDSIDAIDMAVRIEKRLGFDFKGPELRAVRTVQDIVDLIHAHESRRAAAVSERQGALRE